MAKSIMIQGTGSSVGKSVLVTALCRMFLQDGLRPCPFKAQNMALNSFVTQDGGEMGRAQVTQAHAAGLAPCVDMNPVLIKPTTERKAQIIVQGKPVANMQAKEYNSYKKRALTAALESLYRLKKKYGIIVIEGAGSPAEINLKKHDIVNMKIAEAADSPVILAADIDKGGVFASLVGTLELLTEQERKRIKGFIINKFRGDKNLLKPGLSFLEKRTGKPVLGVVPYFKDIMLPEEDSVALENKIQCSCPIYWAKKGALDRKTNAQTINITVIRLPYISNFTDFDALEKEPDVRLRYVGNREELDGANVIIIPGTKNTITDLAWLKRTGIFEKILSAVTDLSPSTFHLRPILIGICGGYQMLGEYIYDSTGIESRQKNVTGLGLLPITTKFMPEKVLSQTTAVEIKTGIELKGYQIHHGRAINLNGASPVFRVKGKKSFDGVEANEGRVWGTYLHGIFDNDIFRRDFLNRVRNNLGLKALCPSRPRFSLDNEFDKLADLVRKNIDMKLLYRILNA